MTAALPARDAASAAWGPSGRTGHGSLVPGGTEGGDGRGGQMKEGGSCRRYLPPAPQEGPGGAGDGWREPLGAHPRR